jgi:secreted trypsin-like serine protease
MVSLQNTSGSHFCGGSLIKPDWVVTAAHCVDSEEPQGIQLRIGAKDRTSGGELAKASKITVHPGYDGSSAGNDIALVHLAKPVRSKPVQIAHSSGASGTKTRIIGWGQTCADPGGCRLPKQLQQLDTKLLDANKCQNIDGTHELCTANPNGKAGACYGDSGGPQIVSVAGAWQLIGATSRAGNDNDRCATGPSIYTNVTAYTDWIAKTIGG